MTTNNGVRVEIVRSGLLFEGTKVNEFQKEGTKTAQIRQTVTTNSFYPAKKVTSSLQDNIFDAEIDFGFEAKPFVSVENRVAWIDVPAGISVDKITEKLAAAEAKGACIYRILSNEPILDDNQQYSITSGQKTIDDYAVKQALRYPIDAVKDGVNVGGKLILDANGNVQYRRTNFWGSPKEDVDLRDVTKVYLPTALAVELSGAAIMQGQSIM